MDYGGPSDAPLTEIYRRFQPTNKIERRGGLLAGTG
jgi:hypothetical protein